MFSNKRKPVIIDKTANGLKEAADACPVGCFAYKNDLVFVVKPHSCKGCGLCETITTGIVIQNKENESNIRSRKLL